MRLLAPSRLLLLLSATAVVLLGLGVCVGSTGFDSVSVVMLGRDVSDEAAAVARQIVWDIRLPRTVGAWLAGALLGLAGAIAQGLFRNPLADPYLLGSAAGASLLVALTLVALGGAAQADAAAPVVSPMSGVWASNVWSRLGLTGAAFLGAVLAVVLTLALSRGTQHTVRLLLAGVVVGVVLGALTQLVLLLTPDALQAMQAFLLGSTGFVGWTAVALMGAAWGVCLAVAWALARVLDGLSLGEATAHSLGLPLAAVRMALIVVLALATGAAVAQTGLIAFVGLVAPHLVRALVRCTHGWLMLLASAMGGVLLMAADILARWLLAPQELPVGVLTAAVGGGYLLWLMWRGAVGRSPG